MIRTIALVAVASVELAGCTFARIAGHGSGHAAYVAIPAQADGKPSVHIWRVYSRHHVFNQTLDAQMRDARELSFRPGSYVLELDCWRAGGMSIVDGAPEFPISVRANRHYRVDCAPIPGDDNHFEVVELQQ